MAAIWKPGSRSSNSSESKSSSNSAFEDNELEKATRIINSLEVETLRDIAIQAYVSSTEFARLVDQKCRESAEKENSEETDADWRSGSSAASDRSFKRVKREESSQVGDDIHQIENFSIRDTTLSAETEAPSERSTTSSRRRNQTNLPKGRGGQVSNPPFFHDEEETG